jgi:lipopolysaccharide/colanic/teichoic acid biosynthesis glycosyltransferase
MPEPLTLAAMGGGIGVLAFYARRYYLISKEVVDITVGAIVLVFALPIMAFCAALIKLSSRGPVLFSQVRAGQDGRLFTMYKFRTMHIDAEKDSGAVWAGENDSRVIRTCRWMRISHMDELPQLFQIVSGVMSLVGPRPERPEIMAKLEKHYPNVRDRLTVKPGLTGLAQIRNGYDSTIEGFRHKLEADLEYIEGMSWGLDLRVLALTVTKLLDRKAR